MKMLVCRLRGAFGAAARNGVNYQARRGTAASAGEHGNQVKLWRNLTFFGAFPAIGLAMFNVYLDHGEAERPEFIPYDYLRIRTKKLPWGDGNHSFFHNPHVNALPDGYEDVEHK